MELLELFCDVDDFFESLAHELALRGIPFERQKRVTISYKEQVVGMILLLMAKSELTDLFKQRVLSVSRFFCGVGCFLHT